MITFPYIAQAIVTGWYTRIYRLRWREAIRFNYLPRWQAIDQEIEGASQRLLIISQDVVYVGNEEVWCSF